MLALFFSINLIVSFTGILIIVFRKIPVIVKLPQTSSPQRTIKEALISLARKIKNKTPLEKFSGDLFLQKILSRTRVLVLKIDNKTFHWLVRLREKAQKNKFGENDSYWKGIKDSVSNSADQNKRKTKTQSFSPANPTKEDEPKTNTSSSFVTQLPQSGIKVQKILKEKRPRKKRLSM